MKNINVFDRIYFFHLNHYFVFKRYFAYCRLETRIFSNSNRFVYKIALNTSIPIQIIDKMGRRFVFTQIKIHHNCYQRLFFVHGSAIDLSNQRFDPVHFFVIFYPFVFQKSSFVYIVVDYFKQTCQTTGIIFQDEIFVQFVFAAIFQLNDFQRFAVESFKPIDYISRFL